MGFDGADALDGESVTAELRRTPTELEPEAARSVATTLLADAAFCEPYCEWMPLWYELGLIAPVRYADWRLTRVARTIAEHANVTAVRPRFSRPGDVLVDGRPALEGVSGFRDRFLLADALLHLEWFVHVAEADGITVPTGLIERTRSASVAYYGGESNQLPSDVRRFQALLFGDDEWVRRIDDAYHLDSRLFGLWERLLAEERRRLGAYGE
ncbi:MAG: hypothetical protein PPP55_05460 [Halorubrum sp.]